MYPRNAATPPRIAIGAVVQISDGAVQTSGVSVAIRAEGGVETAGAGTVSHGVSSGIVYYAPTQAETNYVAFVAVAYKTGCIPVAANVITSASATSGRAVLSAETHTGAVIPTVTTLTGHTPQTGDAFARIGVNGAGLSSIASAADLATVAGYVDTEVAAIKAKTDLIPAAPASTTNITAATGIVLAGVAHTGAVIPTVSTLTGHTPQSGDSFARIGANGAGLTDLATAAGLATVANYMITIAPAVWDVPLASHVDAGSTGEALGAAGASGDPWITPLPGAYVAGQAGYIVGTNLDAAVSSVSSGGGLDAAGTRAALGLATANLDTQIGSLATAANLAAVAGYVDTEVAAIKAKTDLIPAAPASTTNITAATGIVLAGVTHTGAVIPTVSNLAGHTPQTGDSFARIGATGSGLTTVTAKTNLIPAAPASTTNITAATGIVLAGVTHTGAVIPTVTTLTGNTPQTGDAFSRIGANGAGLTALATATNLATVDTVVDAIKVVTDALPNGGALTTVQSDLDDIQSRLPAALVSGRIATDLVSIGGSTTALTAFKRAVQGNVIATAGTGSTTSSIVTSSVTPATSVADQLKGRILTFADDTATVALRGQATDITGSTASATPTLAVTALTTAPVAGDTFTIT